MSLDAANRSEYMKAFRKMQEEDQPEKKDFDCWWCQDTSYISVHIKWFVEREIPEDVSPLWEVGTPSEDVLKVACGCHPNRPELEKKKNGTFMAVFGRPVGLHHYGRIIKKFRQQIRQN